MLKKQKYQSFNLKRLWMIVPQKVLRMKIGQAPLGLGVENTANTDSWKKIKTDNTDDTDVRWVGVA